MPLRVISTSLRAVTASIVGCRRVREDWEPTSFTIDSVFITLILLPVAGGAALLHLLLRRRSKTSRIPEEEDSEEGASLADPTSEDRHDGGRDDG